MKINVRFGIVLWDFRIGYQREYWCGWEKVESSGEIPARKNFPLIQAQYEYAGPTTDDVQSALMSLAKAGMTCAQVFQNFRRACERLKNENQKNLNKQN